MAKKELIKQQLKARRKNRVRAKIFGTGACPRLSVFRSLAHIYVQLIHDSKSLTLAAANDAEIKGVKGNKTDLAAKVGELIAVRAVKLGIKNIIFDRAGNKYHGRVKAVAEGARKGGLNF